MIRERSSFVLSRLSRRAFASRRNSSTRRSQNMTPALHPRSSSYILGWPAMFTARAPRYTTRHAHEVGAAPRFGRAPVQPLRSRAAVRPSDPGVYLSAAEVAFGAVLVGARTRQAAQDRAIFRRACSSPRLCLGATQGRGAGLSSPLVRSWHFGAGENLDSAVVVISVLGAF